MINRRRNFEIVANDTWAFDHTVVDEDGDVIDLTNAVSITGTVSIEPGADVSLLDLAVGTGITVLDPAAGTIQVSKVFDVEGVGPLVYQFRVITASSALVYTFLRGLIDLLPEAVTNVQPE